MELVGVGACGLDDLAGHQGKHEDGHGLHDHPHHADEDVVQAVDGADERPALGLLHADQDDAEEDRKEDDLQHRHVAERLEDVLGHHVHEGLKRAAVGGVFCLVELVGDPRVHAFLLGLDLKNEVRVFWGLGDVEVVEDLDAVGVSPKFVTDSVAGLEVFTGARAGLKDVDQHQAEGDGEERGEEVEAECFGPQATQLLDVAQRRHPADDAEEHQRHRNQLEDVDEDVAQRLDVIQREAVPPKPNARPRVPHTQGEADEDLPVQCETGEPEEDRGESEVMPRR